MCVKALSSAWFAHGGRRGPRSPARVAGGGFGSPLLLRQCRGGRTCSVATASAACARGPHHPPERRDRLDIFAVFLRRVFHCLMSFLKDGSHLSFKWSVSEEVWQIGCANFGWKRNVGKDRIRDAFYILKRKPRRQRIGRFSKLCSEDC